METRAWWKEAVVYQIYPRSFMDSDGDGIGDLPGIVSRLPYLQTLGIDVIWLSPVYDSPNDDNGYDIRDYRNIMKEFGTLDDFDRLLAEAHRMGIRIVMDLVVNHSSDEHVWFVESQKNNDNPYSDYYIWREGTKDAPPNNWGSCFGGGAWEWSPQRNMYYLHMFSKKQPDLNWENERVREEVYDMMRWWGDRGIDGFRMDVITMISKAPGLPDACETDDRGYGNAGNYVFNGPRVHEYLREMHEKVISRYDWMTVGEGAGAGVDDALRYAGEDSRELNMIFTFEHVNLGQKKCGKWGDGKVELPMLKKVMTKWQQRLEGKAWNSLYLSNHDQPRSVSRFGNDSERYREKSAKMLATMLHFQKGTVYVYQGEELGMTNRRCDSFDQFEDIEIRNAYTDFVESGILDADTFLSYVNAVGRDHARFPMQWNDGENAGFTTGRPWIGLNENYKKINAAEQMDRPDSVFHYYRELIRLRHEMSCIVYGRYVPECEEHPDVYAYSREYGEERLYVYCNFSDRTVRYNTGFPYEKQTEILIGNDDRTMLEREAGEIILRPYEAVVYYKK